MLKCPRGGPLCWWSMCRPEEGACSLHVKPRAMALCYNVLIKSCVALTRLLAAWLGGTQPQTFNKHQMAVAVFLNSLHTLPYRDHTHTHTQTHTQRHTYTHTPLNPIFSSQSQPLFPSSERRISCLRVYKRSEADRDVMCEARNGDLGRESNTKNLAS